MEEKEDDEEREEREEQASPGLQETKEEREEQASPGPQETKEEEREEQASPGLQETEEQWFCGRGLTTEFCEALHISSRPRLFGVMGTDLERTTPVDHFHNSGYTGSTVFLVVRV